ncbi:MFS transporter [Pseudoalteromonas denitrificans]|uniref:Predicted arabinose efflux permease, MFS family n=1 Tax=Pseudoalteromonas denitrificans DSM 6059 TaxID=1123010 RepID=A0A1I1M0L9_9GAMM|nr:MFS transporter [Pseudoalteromonas denitrificans]SFC76113.1 Predicted arabinose efflux permease, MFS family [Pseudoalteromonas denitrificans DSM 6059]
MNKNVLILALCQGLITTGNIMLVTVTALIGQQLSPSESWITLPVATQSLGLLLATIPASLIMAKIGRKNGFTLGNAIGIIGILCAVYALEQSLFSLFCFATGLIGIAIGFATLYRFAAIEANPQNPSRAISFIMASGIIAAFLGPNLAIWVEKSFPSINFSNTFIALAGLYILAIILLQFVSFSRTPLEHDEGPSRKLKTILLQPKFIIAVSAAMVSFTLMNLLMTATPLAMHRHGFDFNESAFVIQWHVLGMFVPSLFTGKLIEKWGPVNIILIGALLIAACILINLQGLSHNHFLFALFLLGVGWNFMFISATQMVSSTYKNSEKAKSQAANEFLVFSMVTLSSLSAGWLESSLGWQTLNFISIIPLTIIFIGLIYYQKHIYNKPVSIS